MTSIGLTPRTVRGNEHADPEQGEQPDAGSTWLLPDNIGHVEEGSLEEAIWSELGALPRSRRRKPRLCRGLRVKPEPPHTESAMA